MPCQVVLPIEHSPDCCRASTTGLPAVVVADADGDLVEDDVVDDFRP
jgi:hypothetical protein